MGNFDIYFYVLMYFNYWLNILIAYLFFIIIYF